MISHTHLHNKTSFWNLKATKQASPCFSSRCGPTHAFPSPPSTSWGNTLASSPLAPNEDWLAWCILQVMPSSAPFRCHQQQGQWGDSSKPLASPEQTECRAQPAIQGVEQQNRHSDRCCLEWKVQGSRFLRGSTWRLSARHEGSSWMQRRHPTQITSA